MVRRQVRGFTMMEVLVSLAIVTVIAGSIGAYLPLRDRVLAREFRATVARQALASELERLADASEPPTVGQVELVVPPDAARVLDGHRLTRTVTERSPGLFECAVSITYAEQDGERRERLTTLLFRGESQR